MFIAIVITSILLIASLAWLSNRLLWFYVCPICAGVFGTWVWMLVGKIIGYNMDLVLLGMLMGGSVVGISFQIEKRLPPFCSLALFKTIFIPTGFLAAYSLISSWWFLFVVLIIVLIVIVAGFKRGSKTHSPENNKVVEKLKSKMKNCC